MARYNKFFLFAGFVGVIAVLYFFTPVRDYLSPAKFAELKEWILSRGPFAPLLFILIYVAATVFCLPGSVLTLAAGGLFGTALGTLYVIVASNLGASAGFFISRYLGQEVAMKFLRGKMAKFEMGIEKNGFNVIFGLRLLPVVPFNAFNYAAGLSPVKWKDYFLGSLLGMLPGTFVYVSLGSALTKVSLTDPTIYKDPQVWGPFALVIGLALLARFLKKKKNLSTPENPENSQIKQARR